MSTAFAATELELAEDLLAPVSWLAWSRKELYASSDDMMVLDHKSIGVVDCASRVWSRKPAV